MKVVILAGGLGTRFAEETDIRPKPMIEIGGKPILWHIMKIYSHYGYNDFIICLGYKQYMIKEYFLNYFSHNADIKIDLENNSTQVLNSPKENFKVTLIDTGLNSKTAERIKRIKPYLNNNEDFMLTYGDGVADINIDELVKFHKSHGKNATVTAINPTSKFGVMDIDNKTNKVEKFREKDKNDVGSINGGFFVLNQNIFEFLDKMDTKDVMWEDEPLEYLTNNQQLMAYKHNGFWMCMDALRDKIELEKMWNSNNAKWKVWK